MMKKYQSQQHIDDQLARLYEELLREQLRQLHQQFVVQRNRAKSDYLIHQIDEVKVCAETKAAKALYGKH